MQAGAYALQAHPAAFGYAKQDVAGSERHADGWALSAAECRQPFRRPRRWFIGVSLCLRFQINVH